MVAKRTPTGISPPVGVEFGATECGSQPNRSAFLAMPFIITAMVLPAFTLVPTISLPALCATGLEFVPLVIREHLAEIKSHPDVRLFKFDAGLCDGVDLSKDFRLIRLGGFDQRLVDGFLFFQAGLQAYHFQPMLLKDVVQLMALIFGEADFLSPAGTLPPAALVSAVKASPGW
jgi:hypothetical protein